MPTEFKPTHIYKGNRKEKYNKLCAICVFEANDNVTLQFEDGVIYESVGKQLLTKIPDVMGVFPAKSAERNYKPNHYHSGGIDPWQFIEANMNPQQAIGFHLGNVLKYVARHEKKNGLEDLKKALDSLREGIRLYEKHYPETDS